MGLIIDIAGMVFLFGLLVLIPSVAYARYENKRRAERLADPKQRVLDQATNFQKSGEVNVVKMTIDRERLCSLCGKFTEPSIDLFIDGKWTHRSCYEAPTTSVN